MGCLCYANRHWLRAPSSRMGAGPHEDNHMPREGGTLTPPDLREGRDSHMPMTQFSRPPDKTPLEFKGRWGFLAGSVPDGPAGGWGLAWLPGS